MYSFGWSSLHVLKSYSKYKRAKAWGDNIVIDVNCQITWYISDSSKLSINPNLHEMQSEDFFTQLLLHNGGSKYLEKRQVTALKIWWKTSLLWASINTFFCCPFQDFFFQLPKNAPTTFQLLVIHPNHWKGIIDTLLASEFTKPTHCPDADRLVVDISVYLGVFFCAYALFKRIWESGRPLLSEIYIYCVYVHTSMYGRIHTPCIIFNVYCMPHISNTMVGKFSTLPGNEWSRAILPADMGPEK